MPPVTLGHYRQLEQLAAAADPGGWQAAWQGQQAAADPGGWQGAWQGQQAAAKARPIPCQWLEAEQEG